ncbi:S41 family peptidase [Limibacter armeniacum]|uniref:S41 family peptidase n=1 Tax=Limibacter armeniacum TaxID=466084 RepID=UPI002FE554F5
MKKLIFLCLLMLLGCEDPFYTKQQDNPEYIFETFWEELDRHYAFFAYTDLDWSALYKEYREKVTPATSEDELFHIFDTILDSLNDPHTILFAPRGTAGPVDYFNQFNTNQIDSIQHYFSTYEVINQTFEVGRIKDTNFGYVLIRTFDGDMEDFQTIQNIFNSFSDIDGLIMDVRSNRGGMISNTEVILDQLTDASYQVCQFRYRNGPFHSDFSPWINYRIEPENNTTAFQQPVMVLTNRHCFSACEWFVMSASALPQVTVIGDTTGGGSGRPILRELPNGWLLRVSNTQTILPSGKDFQFTGLSPDIPVSITAQDALKNKDTILETTISTLKEKVD